MSQRDPLTPAGLPIIIKIFAGGATGYFFCHEGLQTRGALVHVEDQKSLDPGPGDHRHRHSVTSVLCGGRHPLFPLSRRCVREHDGLAIDFDNGSLKEDDL